MTNPEFFTSAMDAPDLMARACDLAHRAHEEPDPLVAGLLMVVSRALIAEARARLPEVRSD